MKKLVTLLVSLAAGIETGYLTYSQLSNVGPGPRPFEQPQQAQKKGSLGFVQERSPQAAPEAPGSPWINEKK